jgi:hypothetical protein
MRNTASFQAHSSTPRLSTLRSVVSSSAPSRPAGYGWGGLVGGALLLMALGCDSVPESNTGGDGPSTGGASEGTGGGSPGSSTGGAPSGGGSPGPVRDFGQTIVGGETRNGFHTFDLTVDGKNYKVQTNPWGGAEQQITAGGDAIFRVDSMQEQPGGEAWDIAAFPSVYIGAAHGGANPTAGSGLPAMVGSLSSIPTGLSTNASEITYTGNTTYDVYFTHSQSFNAGQPDVYLMVWFHAKGLNPINGPDELWNCRWQPPTYVDSCSGAGSVVIDGVTFHRFIGPNGPSEVISYVPESTMDGWEFDLMDFIDDAVQQGVLTDSMYLQSVQAGFELVTGGSGLTVKGFYADVQ